MNQLLNSIRGTKIVDRLCGHIFGTGRFQYGRLKYFTKYVEGAKLSWAQRLEALGAR